MNIRVMVCRTVTRQGHTNETLKCQPTLNQEQDYRHRPQSDQTTFSDCTLRFYRETNVTFGFCNVTEVNESDVTKPCRWLEFVRKENRWSNTVLGTMSLTPYTNKTRHQCSRGSCTMNTTTFTQNLTSEYRVELGATFLTILGTEELSSFPVTTTSFKGQSRQFLSSTVSSVTSNENSASSDSSFLIWCIIGVTFIVIVISSAVIIIKCRRRTSKKTDGEINYENDVIVNLTGPHIATSIPIQEKTGKNRTGDEVTSAGGDYEGMIENDTTYLNTNLTRHDSNDAQTPVSGGDVYAVVNKTSDKKTSDVGGDIYAVANKSREKTSNNITDVCAVANGANEMGSDVGGDVYAIVNKCSEKMTSGGGGDVYAVVNKTLKGSQ